MLLWQSLKEMPSSLLDVLPVGLIKGSLRRHYRALRQHYAKWRHPFGREELRNALADAGIARGDSMMVHSGIAAFAGFSGTSLDIIDVFKEAVAEEGTLLMPTLSMQGSAIDFAREGKLFDPRSTPSKAGMLTEVFRRSSGVLRSVHPTHSVAVWGKDAAWWTEAHHLADTPCGRGTPFYRLLERRGKVVFAGVGIEVMTFYHCIEELLEDSMPESPFTTERFILRCKCEGRVVDSAPFRLYAPDLARRRRLQPLEMQMRKKNRWNESRAGALSVIALDARDIVATAEEMAEHGAFCYAPK